MVRKLKDVRLYLNMEVIKMTSLRKILGLPEPGDELNKDNEPEPEETLEEWKEKVENKFLKVRGNKVNEEPYLTYFFKYCQYCNSFQPIICFTQSGKIKSEQMLECSNIRLNIKKLDNR